MSIQELQQKKDNVADELVQRFCLDAFCYVDCSPLLHTSMLATM